MSLYDQWRTKSPEDLENEKLERDRRENARIDDLIDELEREPEEWEL